MDHVGPLQTESHASETPSEGPQLKLLTAEELEQEATQILAKAGYNWNGTARLAEDDREGIKDRYFQRRFERSMPRSRFRGASRKSA